MHGIEHVTDYETDSEGHKGPDQSEARESKTSALGGTSPVVKKRSIFRLVKSVILMFAPLGTVGVDLKVICEMSGVRMTGNQAQSGRQWRSGCRILYHTARNLFQPSPSGIFGYHRAQFEESSGECRITRSD